MPHPVRLFNTLTRSIEEFSPIDPALVGLYCCGPTVYGYQHIGNFKTFIFEDLLVRTLRYAGYPVRHIMNITDVGHLTGDGDEGEDKMALAMRREKKKSHEIADYYTNKFFEDWDALGLVRPDVVCKATDHIQEMIELIKRIEDNGFAYFADGNVYFDVMKFKEYGKLARLDLDTLQAGARIDVDPNKRSPYDFVLWFTKSKFENQELQWDSPWGRGYPGWHIECSAMSMKYLGERFDIHCGGIDHIPVHHTNEIAQSEAATGKPWVNVWMHSEFILLNSEKMSKSTGKLLVLDDLREAGYEPAVYRFFCLSASYRSQLNFSFAALDSAKRNIEKLRDGIFSLRASAPAPAPAPATTLPVEATIIQQEFITALCADLNSAAALAIMWKVLSNDSLPADVRLALLYEFDSVFGLGMQDWQPEQLDIPAEVRDLAEARVAARNAKDWSEADRIRNLVLEKGFKIVDEAGSYSIVKA